MGAVLFLSISLVKEVKAEDKEYQEWLKEKNLPHFDGHFVSTHVRALETAALLDLPDAEWEQDFQLRERDVGLWGAMSDQMWQKRRDLSVSFV